MDESCTTERGAVLRAEDDALLVRIRYRQPLQQAILYQMPEGLYILFDEPQRGIASGQFAAWYDGEELIGSGTIS